MPIVDDSGAPLIRLTFTADFSEEEVEAAVAATAGIFARDERVVFVIDISTLSMTMSSARRKHLHTLMETIQRDADRLMLGAIYVAPTVAGRGIITALNWVRGKRPYTVRVASSIEAGLEIARSLL